MKYLLIILSLFAQVAFSQPNRFFISQNVLQSSIVNYYAGTSPDRYILSSTDGTDWTLDNQLPDSVGDASAFYQLSNGDLLCTTDLGYVCNLTQNTSVKISDYSIIAIAQYYNEIRVSDENGYEFNTEDTLDIETSWNSYNLEYKINEMLFVHGGVLLGFTQNGIYDLSSSVQLQSGNFTCAYYDETNGFVYTGTADGHIWKNVISNIFMGIDSWEDLGVIPDIYEGQIKFISKIDNDFFIGLWGVGLYKTLATTTDFLTYNQSKPLNQTMLCFISSEGMIVGGCVSGKIITSPNKGATWVDLGQQFSQTSINCLIKITQ